MECPILLFAFADDLQDQLQGLAAEQTAILRALDHMVNAKMVEPHFILNASREDIWAFFNHPDHSGRIVLFHYGGHAGDLSLRLQLPDGSSREAFAKGFAEFLGPQANLEVVVLNGCATEPQAGGLLSAGIGAVISTSQAIQDKAAVSFAQGLYQSLGGGDDLQRAYTEAAAAVMADFDTSEGFRGLYLDEVGEEAEELGLTHQIPWRLALRPGAERMTDWNIPEISGNPLFNLPALDHLPLPAEPFRYLRWYMASDARVFFGRDYQIRTLYEWVNDPVRAAVIHLYGQSGVGKSSLLVAGLLPRLEASHSVTYVRRDPALGLVGTIRAGLGLGHEADVVAHWQALERQERQPLLIVDQVEEVFTRPWPGGDATAELGELTRLLEQMFPLETENRQSRCILAYRKEFLAELEAHFQQAKLPKEKFFLERLKRPDIKAAIRSARGSVSSVSSSI